MHKLGDVPVDKQPEKYYMFKEDYQGKYLALMKGFEELSRYFRSGNSVPVQQATIKADKFWEIYERCTGKIIEKTDIFNK